MVGMGMLLLSPSRPTTADAPPAPISLMSSTPEAVVLAFTLPNYTLQEVWAQGLAFVRPQVAGLSPSDEPGAPQLPQISVLIGLPPTGTPHLRVLEAEQSCVPLAYPVYPAPAPVPIRTEASKLPAGPTYEFALDEAIYAHDAFYPAQATHVAEIGWLRDHRVARVTFHPLRYNPVRGELEVTQRLVVEIHFDGDRDASALEASDASSLAFESVLRGALLNYQTARNWRARQPGLMTVAALNVPATQQGSYKITVSADGLYRLTYADLQAVGLPVDSLDPRTWQLFEQGQEIAIRVEGEEDGSFDSGDSLLFYGRAPRSRYTAHNVYWLRFGDTAGLRMTTRDVTPGTQSAGVAWTTAHYEQNIYYDSVLPAADGDHWYAADVRPDAPQTVTLTLMSPATGMPTATLRARLVGYTVSEIHYPDHQATFAVNGTEIGELEWSGLDPVTATVVLDRAILQPGDNSVTVSASVPLEGMWLDVVELGYPVQAVTGDEAIFWGQTGEHLYELSGFTSSDLLLYDVTDPQQTVQLQMDSSNTTLRFADGPSQPAAYLALTGAQVRQPIAVVADMPSNLHDETNGADYLIITHANLASAVQPLAAHRQAQGLRVATIDVQDVYDEFSGGLLDPSAIRDFIAYAYAHWASPAPDYILLVGDGSYDFLDHYGYGSVNYVPPYLAMVDPWWGETAADNRYAAVSGDDSLPDVMLGRLPVTTMAEATTVVQKILDYEQEPWLGDWNARHVFVADDADDAGDFAALATVVHNLLTDPWIGQQIYLDDLPAEAARQETLAAWNQGALLVSFVGHSSWHQWAIEALLDIHDVPNLHNDRRWPVLLSMTCFTGFFHHPEYVTLDESLLRLDGGGAVATWSPAGLGVATSHDHLYRGFYQAVFAGGHAQLGPAILAAKLNLDTQAPAHAELLDTYHLFGDPAMALNLTIRPWPYSTYLPIVGKNYSGG
jgi:hypothetical protein